MQYYEVDFLEYEKYLNLTGHMELLKNMFKYHCLYAQSEFVLNKFEKYEKFEKLQRRKEWRKFAQQQKKTLGQKVGKSTKKKAKELKLKGKTQVNN